MNNKTGSDQRIIAASVSLFATLGYRGTSTRDIARLADVNEVTIFRRYQNKHELFRASVEAELQTLTVRADLVCRLSKIEQPSSIFYAVLDYVGETLAGRPNLFRLLQFSALEFGAEFQPMYEKYLGAWLAAMSGQLSEWAKSREQHDFDADSVVLASAASALTLETLHVLLPGNTEARQRQGFENSKPMDWREVLERVKASTPFKNPS